MGKWDWWHQNSGATDYRIRELLRAIWDLHAMYGADDPWLWRGQANASYILEPGMHTRLQARGRLTDTDVEAQSASLIQAARRAERSSIDTKELSSPTWRCSASCSITARQPHILDVSLDPQLALYMAVVSSDGADDTKDGVLFAIKSPTERPVAEFDARGFHDIYRTLPSDRVVVYSAPSVSERLRIQRGLFLCGRVSVADKRLTIPLSAEPRWPMKQSWIWKRMKQRGTSGPVPSVTSDMAIFRVLAKAKAAIRIWLKQRSGLAVQVTRYTQLAHFRDIRLQGSSVISLTLVVS